MQHFSSRLLLSVFVCLFHGPLFSQISTFQKTYGGPGNDIAYDILETSDGYLLAGESEDVTTGRTAALLICIDKNGAVLWQKTYAQFDAGGFNGILAANDGGFIVRGSIWDADLGRTDAALVKVDDAGNLIWHKTIGEPGFYESLSGNIVAMPDGYILSGIKTNPGYSQTFVTRVDNNGETLWSRFTPSDRYNVLRACYVADSLLYLTGTVDALGCWRTMDPATGDIMQSREYQNDTTNWMFNMHRTADGSHVMSGQISKEIPGLIRINGWVQKVDAAGQLIWSKEYKIGNVNLFETQTMLPDGSIVASLRYFPFPNSGIWYIALFKIDAAGEIVWARDLGGPQSDGGLYNISPTADGGLIAVGYNKSNAGQGGNDMYLIKMDALGMINACCTVNPLVIVENAPVIQYQKSFTASDFEDMVPLLFASEDTASLLSVDFCNRDQPTVNQTIVFCPGESVNIGGSLFGQPGIVTDTLPSTTGGCDTIATYSLEYETANQVSSLQLNCPANTTIVAPPGANAVAVSYDLPAANSDCTCPALQINLDSGGASGSLFPTGVHTVCYRAGDACGSLKTCCFSITVESDDVCDTKAIGCLEFELLSVNKDAGQNRVYRIRMTNHCNSELTYAYLQVPNGIQAVAPAGNSLFTTSGGNTYTVRNPNFSPFNAVRFKPAAAGLANGQSDVFRYVLPAQSNPDYIHVAARLVSGAYFEAHLNTFICPVGTEPGPVAAPGAHAADRNTPAIVDAPGVYPNPVSSGATLFISGGNFPDGIFQLQDPSGKMLQESRIVANQVFSDHSKLPAGLYFFKIFTNGLFAGSGKVVIRD